MSQHHAGPLARLSVACALVVALLTLGACGDLAAALPARPTPVPTLARLPSVTPVTPSPTPPPSATPEPITTPTVAPLLATVAVAANVRADPSTAAPIVGTLDAGTQVRLLRRREDWYEVTGPLSGWMFGQVLEVDPATAANVPDAP